MLFAQLPRPFLDGVSAELNVNLGVVSTSVKQDVAEESLYSRLAVLAKYLRNQADTGTVDEPEEYVRGEMAMKWGFSSSPGDGKRVHVFFTASTKSTRLVLAGSASNVIGNQGMELRSVSNLHQVLAFLNTVAREGIAAADASMEIGAIARRAHQHLETGSRVQQNLEFIAKRLMYLPGSGAEESILIGSPIYVALAKGEPGSHAAHRWIERWETSMIVRIWHGRTRRDRADEYARFLEARAIPDYRSIPGNLKVYVLRRDEGDETCFLTVTHWDSEESIRRFAGAEILKAKYYPEDRELLLEFEPEVRHYEVVAEG